jgi:hypothetical protein
MLEGLPKHVRLPEGKKTKYDGYPELSLEDWHKANGVYVD